MVKHHRTTWLDLHKQRVYRVCREKNITIYNITIFKTYQIIKCTDYFLMAFRNVSAAELYVHLPYHCWSNRSPKQTFPGVLSYIQHRLSGTRCDKQFRAAVASPEFCVRGGGTRFGFVKRPKIINLYCTTPGSTLYSLVCVIALGLCASYKLLIPGIKKLS